MADVRSLLKNERKSRRITHPHATYSTTGTLVCLICNIQLKSESLWDGHLRSSPHAMRVQRIRDETLGKSSGVAVPESQNLGADDVMEPENISAVDLELGQVDKPDIQSKKRKADSDVDQSTKRSKSGHLPEGFFDGGMLDDSEVAGLPTNGSRTPVQLPSRPATPMKTTPEHGNVPKVSAVDEDEWAAFEADIAAADVPVAEDAVISAAPITAAEIAAKSREEEVAHQKERLEAELEGDREEQQRKLEEEFEEMGELEERVRKLKEKREALRLNANKNLPQVPQVQPNSVASNGLEEDEDDDDDNDYSDDEWGFR